MSSDKNAIVRVVGENGYTYNGPVGSFIDNLLIKNKVTTIGNDSVVLDISGYKIIGVSNNEKTSWKEISQVSRHPANGGLVKVYTRSGKTTTATLTHSFLKRTEKGIEPVLGSELKEGMRIPVAKYIPEIENASMEIEIGSYGNVYLTRDFGWLCGTYIADGCVQGKTTKISKCIPEYYEKVMETVKDVFELEVTQIVTERANFKGYDKKYKGIDNMFSNRDVADFFGDNFGRGSENKKVASWVYGANLEFIAGLVQGYFDGDGNVNGDDRKSMIRCGSISESLINDMLVLLAYFGIFGSKCLEWSKTGEEIKPFHTIQISRKYAPIFKEKIGFVVKEKGENLNKIITYINREDKSSDQEMIDKIPCVGKVISEIGFGLKLPGASRNYGRWEKKESIGRSTLLKYIKLFDEENNKKQDKNISSKIDLLKQAAYSDVVWDEITKLEYLDDPKEYVYDFTVPGNDSFMVDTCILVHNTLNTSSGGVEK